MAKINENQLENAKQFMSVFWMDLVKPFYNAEDDDDYWMAIIDKANEIFSRFHLEDNHQLREMLFGFICGLEIKGNERRASYLERFYKRLLGKE